MSSNDVQTLANSIIGTSVLAMPYCFAKCGIILSILLLILSTIITRTCCHYLIKASIVTRRKNMELLGFYIFGNSGKTLVELSIIGFLMGTCIAFFVVIGDLCPILITRIFNMQNVNHDSLRFWLIIITTVCLIIPLSLQKNIQSLSIVCKASIAFYICLTIKTVWESFSRFQNDDHWASNISLWNSENILQCLPIFSMAMSCQMQLFEIYENITSFDRIRQNIFHATSVCFVIYTIIGSFGYISFYNQTLSGNILVHFTPSFANDIITLGFILSIACSYPLVIFPCRTSLSSLVYRKVHHSEISPYIPESRYKPLTIFIIFFTMIIGIWIPSVEVIIGFVGSTIGTLICIIFPATCFVKIMQRNTGEKVVAQILIVIGFIIMILGTYSNLNALDNANSGSHLEVKVPADAKLNEAHPILHPNDIAKIQQNEIPPLLEAKDLPNVVKNQTIEEKPKEIKSKDEDVIKISDEGIKKEEQEIAAEASDKSDKQPQDPQQEIKQKDKEIKELKASKDKLEQEVMEMKEVLIKQNKDTQDLVLQKFEEIAEKVDKIEKQSLDNLPSKEKDVVDNENDTDGGGDHEKKPEKENDHERKSVKDDVRKPSEKENEKKPSEDHKKKPLENDKKSDIPKAPVIKVHEESKNLSKSEPSKKLNATVEDHRIDPIVKLLKQQEPLSYKVGEKMSEGKKDNLTAVVEQVKESEKDENVKKVEIKSENDETIKKVEKKSEHKKEEIPEDEHSHEDFKNEMRKKREADILDELLSNIDPLNVQLNSLISRDLKEAKNNDDEM